MYEKDELFIESIGGVTKVAKLCGITRGAVSQWKNNGIPKAQLNFLKTLYAKEYMAIYNEKQQKMAKNSQKANA